MSDQWDISELEKLKSRGLIALMLRQQEQIKLLSQQVQGLKDQLAQADETRMRVAGQTQWLPVFSTTTLTR